MPGSFTPDGGHLTQFSRADMIAQYNGEVESQFAKESFMRMFANVRPVTGTDTIVGRRIGTTSLQRVVEGVRPNASPTGFGKVSLTVDTIILARANRALLNDLQTDFDARSELGRDHGKMLGKFFDQAFLIQAVKGAQQSAPENLGGAIGAGKNVTLDAGGDENDPDKFYQAIKKVLQQMREAEAPVDEMMLLVSPTQFDVLLDNDKLVKRDFSEGNGDFGKRILYYCNGVPILETARIPSVATPGTEHHMLSNVDNKYAYDITAKDAKAKAVLLHPRSLLAGETIPLTSDIYYDKIELQWFIDSYMSFGVTVNRPDLCGAVFAAD